MTVADFKDTSLKIHRLIRILLVLAPMVFALGQAGKASNAISNHDLPFPPLTHKEILVTGGGDGLGLDRYSDGLGTFDPNKVIPDVITDSKGKSTLQLSALPDKYIVTDDTMLSIIGPGKMDPVFHNLELIQYREQKPWKLITRVYVLLFDSHVFCICFGDRVNDSPEFSCDATLRTQNGLSPQLDVGQYMSGTGAFNSHAVFDLSSSGPKLIRLSSGGRDH